MCTILRFISSGAGGGGAASVKSDHIIQRMRTFSAVCLSVFFYSVGIISTYIHVRTVLILALHTVLIMSLQSCIHTVDINLTCKQC